ncbi:DNA glycosylase [Hypoxylon crocopeplum]|nr:DNA glycosylase [Hypoxylon crocopeplum]
MDYLRQKYVAEAEDEPHNKLVDDYLFGFDTKGDFEQWYLGDIIVNGWAAEDEIKEFARLSLLRGVEQWHQMLCCANAMREKASFDDPLDGQDLLTFLTEVLQPSLSSSDKFSEQQTSTIRQTSEDAKGKSHSVQLNTSLEQTIKKRKRHEPYGKTDPAQSAKKRRRDKESPFWPEPHAQPSNQQAVRSVDERQRLKKARRKERGSKEAEGARNAKSHTIRIPPQKPTLCEVVGIRRKYQLLFKRALLTDGQESVSGTGVLRDQLPPPVSSATEEAESLKDSLLATSIEAVSDIVEKNLDTSGKGDGLENYRATSAERGCICAPSQAQAQAQVQTPKRIAKSPYFDTLDTASPLKARTSRPLRGTVSCIPFPRLDAPKFGLIQEEFATDPFRLLIAVTFLIRVKGKHAIPVFRKLMDKYPTPRDLAEADTKDIVAMIRHLGLAAVRAAAIQKYARMWMEKPPRADVRYDVKNYPRSDDGDGDGDGDGVDSRAEEALSSDDSRLSTWEIGHMTQGRYAIDSWRIFCRDVLLDRAEDWRGKGREGEFQPEWMRVLPEDKELRACLRWLWMQEGWAWDPKTGEKDILSEDLRKAVDEGRVGYDDAGELKILDKKVPVDDKPLGI